MNECVNESGNDLKIRCGFSMLLFLVQNLFKRILMSLGKILISMSVTIYSFINRCEIALIWRSSESKRWCYIFLDACYGLIKILIFLLS